jgi:hypothetical protein
LPHSATPTLNVVPKHITLTLLIWWARSLTVTPLPNMAGVLSLAVLLATIRIVDDVFVAVVLPLQAPARLGLGPHMGEAHARPPRTRQGTQPHNTTPYVIHRHASHHTMHHTSPCTTHSHFPLPFLPRALGSPRPTPIYRFFGGGPSLPSAYVPTSWEGCAVPPH